MKKSDISSRIQNLSILLVEDHHELREETMKILDTLCKHADSCKDGTEALERYKKYSAENKSSYDIVISDIVMPQMNGIELTKNIYSVNPKQSVIILSAYDDTNYLLELINLGVERFIQKPIDYQELLKILNEISYKNSFQNTDTNQNTRRITIAENTTYNKDTKSIFCNNKEIYLTKFEIIFIELLTSKIGKIHSNENIVLHYKSLEEQINSSNIRKVVSKLKKKLPTNIIESVYGVGYKLSPYHKD